MPFSICRPRAVLPKQQGNHPDVQAWMDEEEGAPMVWHRPTLSNVRTRRVRRGFKTCTRTPPPGFREEWMGTDVVYPTTGFCRLIQPWYKALYDVLPVYLRASNNVIAAIGSPASSIPLQSSRPNVSNSDPTLPVLSPQNSPRIPSPVTSNISSTDGYDGEDSITMSPGTPVHDDVPVDQQSSLDAASSFDWALNDVIPWEDLVGNLQGASSSHDRPSQSSSPASSSRSSNVVSNNNSRSSSEFSVSTKIGSYPPSYWEDCRPSNGGGCYNGLRPDVTCLMRPVFLTKDNRLSTWGLPWRGDEEEIFPVYMTSHPPYTFYVLKPAFGWGTLLSGPLPVPAKINSHLHVRVITLYAVWHARLGTVNCDRDLYELERTGLLVVSSNPNELVPQDLRPAYVSSLSSIEHSIHGSNLELRPLTLPLSALTSTTCSHNSYD